MNQVVIKGRLAFDATRREWNGLAIFSCRVCNNNAYYDKKTKAWKEDPIFIDVSQFEPKDESLFDLRKGEMVFVTGSLRQKEYEKDGQKKKDTYIKADSVLRIMEPRKAEEQDHALSGKNDSRARYNRSDDADDIPY